MNIGNRIWRRRFLAALVVMCSAAGAYQVRQPAQAQDAEKFFADHKIRLVVGSPPGGGYDTYGRLVARHLGTELPGHPTITVQNLPGASGAKAVNYLYAMAPRDGSVIATFNNAMPFYELIGQPGIQFKSAELSWLGSLTQTITVVSVWHTTGVKTIEDARRIEVVMGATGAGGTMAAHPALLNNTLGTRFKIITGYEGGNAVNLAMERGEVEGRAATPWATWKTTRPDWVRDGKIVPLVQMGAKKDTELPNVPLLTEFAQNEEQRRMFEFVAATTAMDQPFAGPPGIPSERLTDLRRAFDRMTKAPTFRADAARLDVELDPLPGEEVEKIVAQIMQTLPAIVEKVKAAMTVKEAAVQPGGSSSQGGAK